jgi:2-keto-4-pentenoate hydratase
MNHINNAAALLRTAQTGRAPIAPLTERYSDLDVVDAYAIQQVNLTHRLNDGRILVGHKIGLTSEPMQTLLGVDEPDFGYILDDMVLRSGSAKPAAWFCAPRVEPEVALSPTGPGDHASITISGLGTVSLTFT